MSDNHQIKGYCPMGCGDTLFVASGGYITCSWEKCPNPTAVADLLADRETEHIVQLGAETFDVQHPLRERPDGALFTCDLHQRIAALSGPPRQPGRYRVRLHGSDWTWEPLT